MVTPVTTLLSSALSATWSGYPGRVTRADHEHDFSDADVDSDADAGTGR